MTSEEEEASTEEGAVLNDGYVQFWVSIITAAIVVAVVPILCLQWLMMRQMQVLERWMKELLVAVKQMERGAEESPLDQFTPEAPGEADTHSHSTEVKRWPFGYATKLHIDREYFRKTFRRRPPD